MKEFSTAVVIPRPFTKDGVIKCQFYGIAGRIPNKNMTEMKIALEDGFVIGKKHEVIIMEKEPNHHGRRFSWISGGVWEGSISQARKEYGDPIVVNTNSPDDFVVIGSDKAISYAKPSSFIWND